MFPYHEACVVRDRWLGAAKRDGGIFGLLHPAKPSI